jgi:hypothetical protein
MGILQADTVKTGEVGPGGSGWWRTKSSCVVSIHFLSELRLSKANFFFSPVFILDLSRLTHFPFNPFFEVGGHWGVNGPT